MTQELLLVGSLPLDTAEDVFRMFGRSLGKHMDTMPDGETGPRHHWVSRVHYQVLAGHPELEYVRHPAPEDGAERQHPRDGSDTWQFRVKPGVAKVRFGDPGWRLGFARDALNSYFVFKTMKEKGEIPRHLRFQVSLPSVNSTMHHNAFVDHADLSKIRPGYQDALAAELEKIAEKIPNDDLAIQWDCALEITEAYGLAPGLPKETATERNVAQFKVLSPRIPEKVQLGYHFCFGTLGGWPPTDLGPVVEFANAVVAASGRKVDWMHLPVTERTDDAFYAPLKKLEPRGARVFLGLIHNIDTFEQRVAAARKYLPDFGFAAYCGFGREPPSQLPEVLKEHQRALAYLK